MKLDMKPILDSLKAKGLPILEKDLAIITDAVFDGVQSQAVAQAATGDFVATVVAGAIPIIKPVVHQLEDKIDGVAGNLGE